ncbi:MAG: hypothetical protein IPJ23_03865 [Ignavibacteriales bacterium]|nr:hypothetical protein [Ignavibacteriales bacterium]
MIKYSLILLLVITNLNFSQDKHVEIVGGLDSIYTLINLSESCCKNVECQIDLLVFLDNHGEIDSVIVAKSSLQGCNDFFIGIIKNVKFIPAYNYKIKQNISSVLGIPIRLPSEMNLII